MQFVELEQGSVAWKEYRSNHIGASDAPHIMGVGYKTAYQLWRLKMGLDEQKDSPAMARGRALEAEALEAYNVLTGREHRPVVVQHSEHSWMSASLDGLSECGQYAVEVKNVKREYHEMARRATVPTMYWWQCQHQLEVTGLQHMNYWSYDATSGTGVAVLVERDDDAIEQMLALERSFMDCLENLTPPVLGDRDYRDLSNHELFAHCSDRYASLLAQQKDIESELVALKQEMISIAEGPAVCGNVKLIKSFRKGSVKYNQIPALEGVNLDQYRGKSTEIYSVRVS